MKKKDIIDILSNDDIIIYEGTDRKKIESYLRESRIKAGVKQGVEAVSYTQNSCPTSGAGCNCPMLSYCVDSFSPCTCA